MEIEDVRNRLRNSGLRVTPQRVAVLSALVESDKHPGAEQVVKVVREQFPNISVGAIYHILDNLVQKGIINKVQTEQNVVRYDAITKPHIHLISKEENRIVDYMDEDLFQLINQYFEKKNLKNFNLKEISLQLIGDFRNNKLKTK